MKDEFLLDSKAIICPYFGAFVLFEGARTTMSGNIIMRLGGQAMAAVLGGPGIFYVWLSFYDPLAAVRATIFLGAAMAISIFLYPDLFDGHRGTVKAIQRIAGRVAALKTRR
jgi:hypothetical protein